MYPEGRQRLPEQFNVRYMIANGRQHMSTWKDDRRWIPGCFLADRDTSNEDGTVVARGKEGVHLAFGCQVSEKVWKAAFLLQFSNYEEHV
jgi:hypothetical protein